jgi:hypothetical protein
VVLLVGGVALVTLSYRHSLGTSLLPVQQIIVQEAWANAATLLQRYGWRATSLVGG